MANTIQYNKEEVLSKATAVFHKKGYNGTGMQDLVDATGLNRSSIYNSFGSKMDLYLATLDVYKNTHDDLHKACTAKAKNGYTAIQNVFKLFVTTIIKDLDNKGCMIVNCKSELGSSSYKEVINWLIRSDEKGIAFFESLIKKGQEDGSINKLQSTKKYALYITTCLQGLRMTGIMNKNRKDLEALASTFIQALK
ncbi:TetR/AcrR family transcriptional regulator [Spongiivirga citrea]|uniref:TetR family transcriptional regulator n=1 Tax=Spongiivirga citrea TaxID=1481457 RepID=A0A6M0CPT7_9FLAO|nr:TetR/AcrR family transcriptional regulator [Spongiivirga citrea]NER18044.1 TetR family transcriptional regulator [Spongiivirga citrea]